MQIHWVRQSWTQWLYQEGSFEAALEAGAWGVGYVTDSVWSERLMDGVFGMGHGDKRQGNRKGHRTFLCVWTWVS